MINFSETQMLTTEKSWKYCVQVLLSHRSKGLR